MVELDRHCIDVLTQISAIQAALDKVALGLLDGHARARVPVEQSKSDLVERGLDRGYLREDVDAVSVQLDHPLDATDLTLDSRKARQQVSSSLASRRSSQPTLRRDLAGAAGTDSASLILNGRSLVAIHDGTFLLGPAFCAAIGNGLMLGYMMFRSGLVPRRFAQFGILAGSLALLTAILVLFRAYGQTSTPGFILTLPEAIWELSLGIYLIAKGFRRDASLFERSLRTGETATPTRAEPVGA